MKKKRNKIVKRGRKNILFIILIALAIFAISYQPEQKEESHFSITIISPENKTYNYTNIPVYVNASETVLWMTNSFDDGENITECGNCNWYIKYDLNFNPGTHTVSVYASDYENRVSKAVVVFTVKI